jgi:3-oxoacyl-[acyl-carrier protein] reductase
MDLGIKNKVAFVAASSQGLGKAVALELAKEGCIIIINGRNKTTLDETKKVIEKYGEVLAIAGDVSVKHERDQIIDTGFACI